ncbi:MAG: transposase [Planctomyces sp.]
MGSEHRRGATLYFKRLVPASAHRKLEPVKTLANSIEKRLGNVVSYCTNTHTGAGSEGMSGLFMSMKCRGGGFTKRESVAAVICFCGV